MRNIWICLVFLCMTALSVFAAPDPVESTQPVAQDVQQADKQSTEASEEGETEIDVEVVGTHEWPAKVETVTTQDVEKMAHAVFIGNVIERLPGVDTLHGCLNGAQLITIRGNNSEWTQLMLEGIPLSPIGRPYILSFVPMAAVDTVRILTGPVPPKYHGTTIAGLVLMDMKTGDRYPGVQVNTTIGGFGERIFDVNIGGGKPDRSYFISFTHNETEGWMPHSDMDFNFLSGKFVLAPDDRSKLTLAGANVTGKKNGPRPLGPNPVDKWASEWTDVKQPKASITYERKLSDRSDLTIRYIPTWFSGTQAWSQWFKNHTEERFMPWEYDLFRAELQHDIRLAEDRIVTWGGSWQKDIYRFAGPLKMTDWDAVPDSSWREYDKEGRSVYAQYTQPAGKQGTITLGGRYDVENPGQSIASPFGSWHTRLNSQTGLRLALTRNRRFPTLIELFGQGVWIGNPALQPEMGWTYQADLTRNLRNGTLSFSIFNSELEDLVVADEHNTYENLGKARVRGIDLGWQGMWKKGDLWASYSYLDAKDSETADPLIAAFRTAFPKHSAKAGMTIKEARGGFHTFEILAYGRRRTDVDEPTYVGAPWNVIVPPELPGFTWVNYKYTLPLGERRSLTLAIENLLNVEAQDLLFYPRPGRWLSGTLTWHF